MAKLIPENTNKDDIVAYLRDPDDDDSRLTGKQKELLDWYVDAYTLMRNYNSVSDTIQILKKLGERRGQPISIFTARRYINDALDIFGQVSKMKTEVIKHLVIETLMDARQMAKEMRNPMAMIQAAKELNNVGGVEDAGALYADEIERHTVVIELDQTAKRALQQIYKGGIIDLDSVMQSQAEDAQIVEDRYDSL